MTPTPRLKSCGVRESAFGRLDLEGDACAMFAAEVEALTMEGSCTKASGRRGERLGVDMFERNAFPPRHAPP
jgi:hypothetical protein